MRPKLQIQTKYVGFEPRIILATYVQPFIKGQKNDYNYAEAIAEGFDSDADVAASQP